MNTESKFVFYGSFALVLAILIIIILSLFTPEYTEPIYRPIPETALKTESGRWIKIQEEYPEQDYLLLFYVDTSPTSIQQLIELGKIADQIPPSVAPLLVHIGRLSRQLPIEKREDFHYLTDLDAEFTRSSAIDIVPSLLLITNEEREIFYSESLISSEEIIAHLKTLERSDTD